MPYPTVIVTGDSIAQMSFKAGGYGSTLVDLVWDGPCSEKTALTVSIKATLMSSTVVWAATIRLNCCNGSKKD
jgi:hypothetical protein